MNATTYLIIIVFFISCSDIVNEFYYGKDPTEIFHVEKFGEDFSVEENILGRFSVVGKDGSSEDFRVSKGDDRNLGHFTQNTEVIQVNENKKVDILWNIDNSGSMGNEQSALADNFSLFIEDFAQKDIDFKMAIITTDSAVNKDTDNKLNSVELKKNKEDFITDFKNKIRVGTDGSFDERAFEMTKLFFESYYTNWNRQDAQLIVIFASDEEEGGSWSLSEKLSVNHYTNAIVQSKGGNAEAVRVFAICNRDECDRFSAMSQATNGLTRYIDGNFADISKKFGESIVHNLTKLKTVFNLNITPKNMNQLKIEINGSAVSRDTTETNGWNYDGISNAVKFFGDGIPPAGAGIKVYEEGVPNDRFCLAQRLDPSEESFLVVEVNGVEVPKDVSNSNGWNHETLSNCVRFFGSYVPDEGDNVNISLPGTVSNSLCLKSKLNVNRLGSVQVSKGGDVIPYDATKADGWSYDNNKNCIEFFGSHTLSAKDVVHVSMGLVSKFCLKKEFDLNKLDEIEVMIGGQKISRDTAGIHGWDYNDVNHCIELYGNHGLSKGASVKISWGKTSKFCLNRPLDENQLETVVIKVDGAVVESKGSGVGWDYDRETNCISFFGDSSPGINSIIKISYTPEYRRNN